MSTHTYAHIHPTTHTHTHMHACTHTHTHTHTNTHTHTHTVCIHACTHTQYCVLLCKLQLCWADNTCHISCVGLTEHMSLTDHMSTHTHTHTRTHTCIHTHASMHTHTQYCVLLCKLQNTCHISCVGLTTHVTSAVLG
eukprot:TRINITY_DN9551_c0_g1_i17.p1 TRINITY_DN9551_c0_g1~~TRINITY_DN9551_c0_g1_i17.p1  ORF type:complete len:138 (-),score=28.45 TRINITY_DN9551_c0_g1_i17:11-424(-)